MDASARNGGWRASLDQAALRLVQAYERNVGGLPAEAQEALAGTGGALGVQQVQRILAETCAPGDVQRALASVQAGVNPVLGHGGREGFVDQLAELKKSPTPKKKKKGFLARIFGSANDREVDRLKDVVADIEAEEPRFEKLSEAELKQNTDALRARFKDGASLDDLLPEAFAAAREVSKRVLNMRHYDTQLMGGVLLHQGKVAEMVTGEGKTLAATLPAYLNALSGEGVHIVTVNDYLAKRDTQWMGPIYHALGLEVGVLQSDGTAYVFDPTYSAKDPKMANLRPVSRKEAYAADITYGTSSEFGFDYLRDNIAPSADKMVQRSAAFAIVDEVDNILIDEARTPLIISGPSPDDPSELCRIADAAVRKLKCAVRTTGTDKLSDLQAQYPGDYIVDEKRRNTILTDAGLQHVEAILGIDDLYANPPLAHRVQQALLAHSLYDRDDQYIVDHGQAVIVDETTGRPFPGRRWSNGLHQAIEAKEGLEIHRENRTLARISIQNYFRRYDKLAGMTGTAQSAARELFKTHGLEVVSLPTHKPLRRESLPDLVYATKAAKDRAIIRDILAQREKGRPVLVGTTSVEDSEALSAQLKALGVPHQVLNAKEHEREAEIVAQAGRSGTVTIATNMAGRGTDIKLGGDPDALAAARVKKGDVDVNAVDPAAFAAALTDVKQRIQHGRLDTPDPEAYAAALVQAKEETEADKARVRAAGGLHVIGTTRHESRRIDEQLLGRAGRQGDPGSSRFFVSLEDDLMRLFGSGTINFVKRFWSGARGDEPIRSRRLTKGIERAQQRVEDHYYEIRKNLLDYDDVLNVQRNVTYRDRRKALELTPEGVEDNVESIMKEAAEAVVELHQTNPDVPLEKLVLDQIGVSVGENAPSKPKALAAHLENELLSKYRNARESLGDAAVEYARRSIVSALDLEWRYHLEDMDILKDGIHFRAYAQRDPLTEYKIEAYDMYQQLQKRVQMSAAKSIAAAGAK